MNAAEQVLEELTEKMRENPPPPNPRFRVGRFALQLRQEHEQFERQRQDLMCIMSRVFIVKASADFYSWCVEYVAYSDDFDEVEWPMTPPEYRARLHRGEDGRVTLESWEKVA